MDIAMVYFSQTGNTERVARSMADAFKEQGHAVSIMSWKDVQLSDITRCNVFGIGSPCFESQAPAPVKAFLKRMPLLKGKPSFVFATCGGAPGRILYDLSRGLRKKKARVIAGFMCHGEVRHPAPCLEGRMPDRPGRNDLDRARDFAMHLGDYISAEHSKPMPGPRGKPLDPGWGFYSLVSFVARPPLLRLLLPKPRLVPSSCTWCGSCVRECPVSCISSEQNPVPGRSCIRCYRCITVCPNRAHRVRWWYGNLVIWALYNTLFFRLFGDLEPGESIY